MNPRQTAALHDFQRAFAAVEADLERSEAENGLFHQEPGDCFVADEDRELPTAVYFAGVKDPNPVSQEDSGE